MPVFTLGGQKKTAPIGRDGQELPKILGFLISKANLMRSVPALTQEVRTQWHKALQVAGAGMTDSHGLAPLSTLITSVLAAGRPLPSRGS